jgi:NAD(P)-dependent dehydrogenase (short-subunit alcohol dehydrogenase family)
MTSAGMFPYAAAKSGLVGLTRSLALEVGPRQIRVNALSPGYTETPLASDWFLAQPPEKRQEVLAVHPMGRMASPKEIANCVRSPFDRSVVCDGRELARRRRIGSAVRVGCLDVVAKASRTHVFNMKEHANEIRSIVVAVPMGAAL